jgi:hypothetical protein
MQEQFHEQPQVWIGTGVHFSFDEIPGMTHAALTTNERHHVKDFHDETNLFIRDF